MSNKPHFSQFSPEEQRIFNRFPKMFRQANLSMQETCMCWGLEIPESWYCVIEELAGYINEIAPDCIEFSDIKQKWGELRVYYDVVGEISKEQEKEIDDLIRDAEFKCNLIQNSK